MSCAISLMYVTALFQGRGASGGGGGGGRRRSRSRSPRRYL
jgi:hypothetical protein